MSSRARAAALAGLAAACLSGAASAQTPAPTPAWTPASPSPLMGTWTLAEADEIRADGTHIQNYGADARGLLLVDARGRYSLQIFRQGRPHFASGDKFRGSAGEFRDAVTGMSTHYGRVELDADGATLVFHIEQAAFPNWEGATQRRRYRLVDGVLSYEVPPAADGTVARSVWRRLD